jgi:hypothetical protein
VLSSVSDLEAEFTPYDHLADEVIRNSIFEVLPRLIAT